MLYRAHFSIATPTLRHNKFFFSLHTRGHRGAGLHKGPTLAFMCKHELFEFFERTRLRSSLNRQFS